MKAQSLYISKTPFPEFVQEGPEKISWPQKIWNSWPLWPLRKTTEAIFWVGGKISSGLEWFSETWPGKIFKAVTSSPVFRAVAVVVAVLTLAGVLATPGGPVVAAVIGSLGLAAVGVGVAMDTIQTRNTRRLVKENNLLVENRTNKSSQDYILNLDPKLQDILKDDLYTPAGGNKKSTKERYTGDYTESLITPKAVGKAVLRNSPAVASSVLQGVTTGGITLIKDIGMSALSLAMETGGKVTMDTVRFQLKKQIDEERNKSDTPGYDSIRELKKEAREQRIQTAALKKLVTEEDYWGMSNDQIKERFNKIKEEMRGKEEKVSADSNFFVRGMKTIGSYVLDAGRAHNPFSKYNNPQKIKVETSSNLTKSMESIKGIESIKEDLKHHTAPEPFVRAKTTRLNRGPNSQQRGQGK